MLKNGIFCGVVILVVFKVFLVVKNLEIPNRLRTLHLLLLAGTAMGMECAPSYEFLSLGYLEETFTSTTITLTFYIS